VIGLGWLDDSMGPGGPSEEDKNYIVDTGASGFSMGQQVEAYRESMYLPPGMYLSSKSFS